MPDSEIASVLVPYGVTADQELCGKIRKYTSILLKWNKLVSLTTIVEPRDILRFHFGESFFAVAAAKIGESRLADVGSGAGFPGLPLKITIPSIDLVLIESNTKKCAFLSEVIRRLGLSGVEVLRGRMDDFQSSPRPFDFITARALGNHSELLKWSRRSLAPRGRLVLWLGEKDADEISRIKNWNWKFRTLIPGSKRRYILVGIPAV